MNNMSKTNGWRWRATPTALNRKHTAPQLHDWGGPEPESIEEAQSVIDVWNASTYNGAQYWVYELVLPESYKRPVQQKLWL